MEIPSADLGRIRDLYLHGRYRQAWALSEPWGPFRTWSGAAARLLAGRLAIQLGAPRLGKQLHLAAVRESPSNLEAIYYHARYRLEQFGPWSCLRYVHAHPDWSDASPELRADWLSVQALALSRMRDFDRAERLMQQAEALAPDRAWLQVERASMADLADRPADALKAAQRALTLQPWFRPGVQAYAQALIRQHRERDAADFLKESLDHLESGIIAAQLASLLYDLRDYPGSSQALDRYEELSPLIERDVRKWLHARRADLAYQQGDGPTMVTWAQKVGEPFYDRLATQDLTTIPAGVRLEAEPPTHETPLAEWLTQYWKVDPIPELTRDYPPAHDGLPDFAERERYQAAGWVAREFVLNQETAQTLITRQVPFLVALVETGYSQTRMVVGSDPIRGSVTLADGPEGRPAEAPLSVLAERYRLTGPRALVVVPPAEAHRLEGITFPEAEQYDRLFALQRQMLVERAFTAAHEALIAWEVEAPAHRITKLAGLAWARATAHPVLLLESLNNLLADYPGDATLVIAKAAVLRDLGRTEERLALLQAEGQKADADPLLMQSLAQMLLTDPTAHHEVDRLLRRSLRLRPHAPAGYFLLGTDRWESQQWAESIELYRMAACLDDREPQFAEAYAKAAQATDRGPDALRLFQQKALRVDRPSVGPVKALFEALWDRDEPDQAFSALNKAIDRLSDASTKSTRAVRAELLLYRAEMHAQFSRFELAEADLEAAREDSPAATWYRLAARVARIKPDYHQSRQYLEAVLIDEPLSYDVQRLYTTLLADTEGRPLAREHLARLAQRYPYVYSVLKLRAEYLATEPDEAAVTATQALLDLCPRDAWAARQLALVMADRKRTDEARTAIQSAGNLEPNHPSQLAVVAHVHRRADQVDEALESLRTAIRQFPDHELAIFELIQISRGLKEKKSALRFVAEQLHAHPATTGEGLIAYFEQAMGVFRQFSTVIDPDEYEKFVDELNRFLDERPDLWQAWSVVVQGLTRSGRFDEALSLARDAVERFPLVARLWYDLAEVCDAAERADERLEALRRTVAVAPGWLPAVRDLAEVLEATDHPEEALAALQRAAALNPLDPLAHWLLAERLWQSDRGREALDQAARAVRLDPGIDPRIELAWSAVQMWSDRLDVPEEAIELARSLTRDRAGDPRAWLRLARTLNEPRHMAEALSALDVALRLDPRNIEAHDLKAERLASLGRFDEALEAARPPALATELPLVLQGRAAWVEARRGNYAAAIPPMQALVAVDPEYIWGWQQLAEWYNDTGRTENYLEAASELVRLRPEHPLSLTMRGEARLQSGDRDGGKEDLREALRLHPGYSPAAVLLFDACLADEETREARTALAMLQEHMAGPEVLVKQLQYAARTGEADSAARTFGELCQLTGDSPPDFLRMGLVEMAQAGWDDKAAELMQSAWQGEDDFNPWAAIYWLDTSAGEDASPEIKLQATDAAIKHYPHFIPAHDRRAEQLAQMGRFDEARQACQPAGMGPEYPVALRGRAAWVEVMAGDRSAGIAKMRALVDAEPDYAWGWRQLTHWYDAAGMQRECLEASDNLVRLSPYDPVAHAVRGEARRVLGDHRGACDDFRTAFELDPDFHPAGLQLIAAQLTTDDLTGAARTLQVLRESDEGPLVRLRGVQVAARLGDLAAARADFLAMITDQNATTGILRDALTAMGTAGWEDEAEEDLTSAVSRPGVTTIAAALWVEQLASHGIPWKVGDRIPEIIAADASIGREVVLSYAMALVRGERSDVAIATVQRYAELLRGEMASWARGGEVLYASRHYALTAAWLADWKDRGAIRPWMVRPLMNALRALDRDDDADQVLRQIAETIPHDELPSDLTVWMALTAVMANRLDDAEAALRLTDPLGLPDGTRLIRSMAEAVLMVRQAGPAGKAQAFAEAREHLRSAADGCAPAEVPPGGARWFRKVVDALASDVGGLAVRAWALRQRLAPWVRDA